MTQKVRVVGIDTDEDKMVHPIDAKELVATGRYNEVESKRRAKKEKVQQKKEEAVVEQTIAEKVNNMKGREIMKYVRENDIVIEGLKEMGLKARRDALIDYLENPVKVEDVNEEDF